LPPPTWKLVSFRAAATTAFALSTAPFLSLLQPVSFVVVVDILVGVDVLPMYELPNGGAKHVTGSTGSQVLDELSRVGHSHYTP
jgi:hypothetical protein